MHGAGVRKVKQLENRNREGDPTFWGTTLFARNYAKFIFSLSTCFYGQVSHFVVQTKIVSGPHGEPRPHHGQVPKAIWVQAIFCAHHSFCSDVETRDKGGGLRTAVALALLLVCASSRSTVGTATQPSKQDSRIQTIHFTIGNATIHSKRQCCRKFCSSLTRQRRVTCWNTGGSRFIRTCLFWIPT